jgi:hypothetical protein
MAPTAAAPAWCPPKLDVRGDGRLHYGVHLDVPHNGQTIHPLSVHRKGGCVDDASASLGRAMFPERMLAQEAWSNAPTAVTPFIVLGDFNRRFTQPHERLWSTAMTAGRSTPTSPR